MRKNIAILLMLGMVLVMVGCGSDTSTMTDEELAKKVAELEAENEKLKNQQGNTVEENIAQENVDMEDEIAEIEAEIASWTDDMVIAFSDEALLYDVRTMTGKKSGEITYGDVKYITEYPQGDGRKYLSNIGSLKYFTSLKKLNVDVEDSTDLEPLKYCRELEEFTIEDEKLEDISALAYLSKLKILDLPSVTDIENIDALSNLNNLESLRVGGDNITNIDALSNLNNLESLRVGGNSITNIDALSNLTNLAELQLSVDSVTDISALGTLTNLSRLSLHADSVTDISILGNLVKLNYLSLRTSSATDLSVLGNLTNLANLDIVWNDNLNMEPLHKCTQLQCVRIDLQANPTTELVEHLNAVLNNIENVPLPEGYDNDDKIDMHITCGVGVSDIGALANLSEGSRIYVNYQNPDIDMSPIQGKSWLVTH